GAGRGPRPRRAAPCRPRHLRGRVEPHRPRGPDGRGLRSRPRAPHRPRPRARRPDDRPRVPRHRRAARGPRRARGPRSRLPLLVRGRARPAARPPPARDRARRPHRLRTAGRVLGRPGREGPGPPGPAAARRAEAAPGHLPAARPRPPPPAPPGVEAARDTLRALGAVRPLRAASGPGEVRVTDRGRALARIGLHPRLARALVDGAPEVGVRDAAQVVALLAEPPPRSAGDDLTAAWRALRRQSRPADAHAARWRDETRRLQRAL